MIANRPDGNQKTAFEVCPGRVRSLWDMLKRYAEAFFVVGRAVNDAERRLFEWGMLNPKEEFVFESQPIFLDARQGLNSARFACTTLPLGTLIKEVVRAENDLKQGAFMRDRFLTTLGAISHRIQDELEKHWFFHIDPTLYDFYEQESPFGPEVDAKFKNAKTDIKSAGSCLALGQPTACVLHLMRAMESAMESLSKRLKKPIPPKSTWNNILKDMKHAIERMPEATPRQKRKKDAWSEASANLFHVGEAWRNPTMHPRRSYTPNQAKEVWDAVRVFMTSLARL